MALDSNVRGSGARLAARAAATASLFAVFLCGWLAMRTSEWKRIVLFSALALVAGFLASEFRRRAR